jgi:hypothetical protein
MLERPFLYGQKLRGRLERLGKRFIIYRNRNRAAAIRGSGRRKG